jgi:acyl-CoA reductase-like NAD-dependent aldehyde dehydrogenase
MIIRDQFFIGGAWIAPSTKQTIDVFNAGNGEKMGRVPLGEDKDVDAAVNAARNACARACPGRTCMGTVL